MIVTSTFQLPRHHGSLVHHGIHVSRHALGFIITGATVGVLTFLLINAVLLTAQVFGLPAFARAGNTSLGLQTAEHAEAALAKLGQSQQLQLTIQDKTYTVPTAKLGIELNAEAVVQSIQHPTGWNRVPLFYALHNLHNSFPLQYTISGQSLKDYLARLALPETKAASDATVVIPADGSAPYITPEQAGYQYTLSQLEQQVTATILNDGSVAVVVEPQILEPKIAASDLANALQQINDVLARSLTITNGQASYALAAEDLRHIVTVTVVAGAEPQAAVDHGKLVDVLRAHSNLFYIAPVSIQVSTLDGTVTSRTVGASGQALDIDATADKVAAALKTTQATQAVVLTTVSPNTTYLRNYTATSAGLLALIKDFAASHSGIYAVATLELNGNRSAYYNQDVATVPASTYKLFVAYVALLKIQQGSLSFNSSTSAGSLDYCLQKMIIVSDNTCAHAIFDLVGWDEVEDQVLAAGFSHTNVDNSGGGYMHSTAGDLAKLLQGFYDGSLLSTSSTDYLFNLMKQQIYRSGIPAGSSGSTVADKVGFLESWNHDAAIVYGPKSTYILVILTTNGSFAQIKDLASQIYTLYNQ